MITLQAPPSQQESSSEPPWLLWYEPGVPGRVDVPDRSLPSFLAASAERNPERCAIRFFGRDISYHELDESVRRFAAALIALGVRKGDRVGLLFPNCPQMVIAFYGALLAGAVVVPASPLLVDDELETMWGQAGVQVVVCLSVFYPRVQAVRRTLPHLEYVIVANIKDYFSPLTWLLFTLWKERKDGHRVHLPRDGHAYRFSSLLAMASPLDPGVEVTGGDLALLQPTGGTTGTPKLAMLAHRNLLANALQVRAWFGNLARSDGADVVLGVVPLFHIYGITTVLNYSMVHGGTMILRPQFAVKDVLKAIAREKPDFFPGVPTMYMAINNAPGLKCYNLRSLKAAISGAAPLPPDVQTRFESLTGAKLVEGYGLTEASPVTHCNPLQGRRKIGSIGVPFPSTDAAIFDQETGTRLLPPGEIGELAVRGPQIMLGYWRDESETAQVLKNSWLFTGDLASVDGDGFFTIVDRKKDLIITGGMNVYPRDVEDPLYEHPKVQRVVAAGIPDERWGEAVKVYIVLKRGCAATEEEIIEYCRTKMAHYKVPKHVEFRSDLPQNLIGKVLRRTLRGEEQARQIAQLRQPSKSR